MSFPYQVWQKENKPANVTNLPMPDAFQRKACWKKQPDQQQIDRIFVFSFSVFSP